MKLQNLRTNSNFIRQGAVILVLLLTLAVRIERATRETIVNPDVIRFIDLAKQLEITPKQAVRNEVYHPLHAMVAWGFHAGVTQWIFADSRDAWIWAFKFAGIAAAVTLVYLLMKLVRRMGAPWWAACGAGVVWAIGRRTSGYGADGLSDMLFLSLFLAAILVGMNTRMRYRPTGWFLAGVCAGLSYLTRPEGAAALVILSVGLLGYAIGFRPSITIPIWGKNTSSVGRRRIHRTTAQGKFLSLATKSILVMGIGFLLVAGPYMLTIKGFTHKKDILGGVGVLKTSQQVELHQANAGVLGVSPKLIIEPVIWNKILRELWETFGFGPSLVLLGAMAIRPRLWGRPHWRFLIIVWACFWGAVMVWLIDKTRSDGQMIGYLDGRHTLVLLLVLHGCFGLALPIWSIPMRWWQNSWHSEKPKCGTFRWWPEVVSGSACVLACIPGLCMLSLPPAYDRQFVLEARDYLVAHADKQAFLADTNGRLAFYAGLGYQEWQGKPGKEALLDSLRIAGRNRPMILAYIYQAGMGETMLDAIGEWKLVEKFESKTARHGDVLALYARPNDGALH